MSKSNALIVALIIITGFGLLSIIFPERMEHLGTILTAIVSLTGAYIGLQVANNGVKGKCWNQQLHHAENGGNNETQ